MGGVPFNYEMNYDYWGSNPLVNKLWFVNPGLTSITMIPVKLPWIGRYSM